jgi:transmembrane sensor
MSQIEQAAAAWLARRDSGQWTSGDQQAFDAWLGEATAHRVAWLRLQAAWQQADQMQALHREPEGKGIEAPRLARRAPRAAWAFAAVAALAIGLAWFTLRTPSGVEQYATPVGGQEAVTLADGSRVTLNTRTRARALINDVERKVWLDEGEAFFEVQHDPARPFVVAAGNDRVTVLGTKFSVRHEGGRTQVTVLEGRVRLDRAEPAARNKPADPAPTLMTRNEAALSQSGSLLVMAKTPEQVQRDLSWREGRLVFDHMTLGEIAAEFNRYNRRQMLVEGEAASLRLGGSFDAHNIDGFARLVHEGFGLKVQSDGERIRLSSN